MEFEILHLGRMRYRDAFTEQLKIHEEVLGGTRRNTLILLEHPPVITLGASFHAENLLASPDQLKAEGFEVERTDRGGDVTYHGPGQLVAYPIFSLETWDRDLHRYLRWLEECVIQVANDFGIVAGRNPVNTGVWAGNRKVCAMGIKVRRWVSLHGLALNCDADLRPFQRIVPCGIQGNYGVTSLSQEAQRTVSVIEAADRLVAAMRTVPA